LKPRKVRDRIVDYLYRIAPDETTPKSIAGVLRLKAGTVRKEMSRILAEKNSPIIVAHRGFYRHKMNIDLMLKLDRLKRIELHGIKLEGFSLSKNTGYFISSQAKHKYRKRGIYKEIFENRLVTITVHEMSLVEVWLSTSDKPMTFPQFDRFCTWVKAKLDFVDEMSWKLSEIGLNVDIRQLHLDGATSIKLQVFHRAWLQVYQKGEDTVRWEVHMCPDLKLEEALYILSTLVQINPKGGVGQQEQPYQAPPEDKGDYSYG